MATGATEIDNMIALLVRCAPELREAGITSLTIGDVSLTLADAPPLDLRGVEVASADAPPPPPTDPMADPASYPGGRIPGFVRPPKR